MRLVPHERDPLVAFLAQICAELEASVARSDPVGFADVMARARQLDPSITRRARGLTLVTRSEA
jgi:hypothetical protein